MDDSAPGFTARRPVPIREPLGLWPIRKGGTFTRFPMWLLVVLLSESVDPCDDGDTVPLAAAMVESERIWSLFCGPVRSDGATAFMIRRCL